MRPELQEDSEETESQDFRRQGIVDVQPAESENEEAKKEKNPEKALHMCKNTLKKKKKKKKRQNKESLTHLTQYVNLEILLLLFLVSFFKQFSTLICCCCP